MSVLMARLMGLFTKFRLVFVMSGVLLFLSGCETVPSRQQAYAACDNNVGICYRNCEAYEGTDDYGTCQASCEREASACFEQANNTFNTYNNAASSSFYLTPWIGSYCAWYPDRGFVSRYGAFNRGHLGYANSGYFPGRRYRSGNRYDPYYDDYFERRKRRDQGQRRRRNRDRFDSDRGADDNGDRADRRRPRGDRNRRGRNTGERATPPPRRKRPTGVRSDGQRPTSPPRRGERVSPNPRPNGPASSAPTRTPRAGGGRAGARPPANRPLANRPPSSRSPKSRSPKSKPPTSKPPKSRPPRSSSRPTSRRRSPSREGAKRPRIKQP